MIDIIDVGMGNIASITSALNRLSLPFNIVTDPSDLRSQTLILPGVGSVATFMNRIVSNDFDRAIKDHYGSGHKLIGICLGFQVMTNFSEEDGGTKCLSLIDTKTTTLGKHSAISNHNQWEKFSIRKDDLQLSECLPILCKSRKRVITGRVFYNHEYGVEISSGSHLYKPINSGYLAAFAALYCHDNLVGIQFHPEKSQITGLNFLQLIL